MNRLKLSLYGPGNGNHEMIFLLDYNVRPYGRTKI
jgi:hypothetical protein